MIEGTHIIIHIHLKWTVPPEHVILTRDDFASVSLVMYMSLYM